MQQLGWKGWSSFPEVFRSLPLTLFASVVKLVEGFNEPIFGFELEVLSVEPEGSHCVLDGVVDDALDAAVEKVPGQKLEGNHPVVRQVEQVDGVNHLLRRNHHVYD